MSNTTALTVLQPSVALLRLPSATAPAGTHTVTPPVGWYHPSSSNLHSFPPQNTNFCRHPFSRVLAKNVYNEYINDRHHVHMNSTKWLTLTEFVKYLGKTGEGRG